MSHRFPSPLLRPVAVVRVAVALGVSSLLATGLVSLSPLPAGAIVTPIAITSAVPGTPQNYGTSVTITSTISGGSVAYGAVNFQSSPDGSAWTSIPLCATQVVNTGTGVATCVTTALPTNTIDLRASYSGDGTNTFGPYNSGLYPFVVNQAASTISVNSATPAAPISAPVAAGTSTTIVAALGAGQTGTVDFQYSLNGVNFNDVPSCTTQPISASSSTCTTSSLPIGTQSLRVVYSGDVNYLSHTSSSYPYYVKTASTVSMIASPASPVAGGTSVTLTATVGAGQTGTVTFKTSPDGSVWTANAACTSVAISTVTVACTTTTLAAGTNYLQAVYNGDVNYLSQTSASVAYSVTGTTVPTIALLATPVGPVALGTSVAITATVGSALQTGTVAFQSSLNGSTYTTVSGCASVTISGTTAVCTTTALPLSTQDLKVVYSGNGTYASIASAALAFVVSGSTASTISLGASPASPVTASTSVTLTATLGLGQTGTVSFWSSLDGVTYSSIATCNAVAISVVIAACTTTALPAGTQYVKAIYSGSATYAPSTSSALAYAVGGASASTVTLGAVPTTPGAPGSTVVITATLGAGQTGGVNFQYSTDGTTYSSITGCANVTIVLVSATCSTITLPDGTLSLRAVYLGSATKAPATSVAYAYSIQKVAGTLALSASPTGPTTFGTSVAITATVASGESGSIAFQYSFNGTSFTYIAGCTGKAISGTIATCVTTGLPAGSKFLRVIYSGDNAYAADATTISYQMKAVSFSATFASFGNGSRALSTTMKNQIRAFAAQVAANYDSSITIKAYAHSSTKAASRTLSVQRANAIASFLRSALNALHVTGYSVHALGLGVRPSGSSNVVLASAK